MDPAEHLAAEHRAFAERRAQAKSYGKPRRVWVEDGYVFVESYDGAIVTMTPDVAIEMGRLIGNAGADSLVNEIMARKVEPGSGSSRAA